MDRVLAFTAKKSSVSTIDGTPLAQGDLIQVFVNDRVTNFAEAG
jgi:hypothetical protein